MRAIRPPESNLLRGMNADRIAEICDVHVTTARRWKRYGDYPKAAGVLVSLVYGGDLGAISEAFSGWCIRKGMLISPNDESFAPGEIMGTHFWKQLVRSYQRDQRLPQQADWVEGEWVVNEHPETSDAPAKAGRR